MRSQDSRVRSTVQMSQWEKRYHAEVARGGNLESRNRELRDQVLEQERCSAARPSADSAGFGADAERSQLVIELDRQRVTATEQMRFMDDLVVKLRVDKDNLQCRLDESNEGNDSLTNKVNELAEQLEECTGYEGEDQEEEEDHLQAWAKDHQRKKDQQVLPKSEDNQATEDHHLEKDSHRSELEIEDIDLDLSLSKKEFQKDQMGLLKRKTRTECTRKKETLRCEVNNDNVIC